MKDRKLGELRDQLDDVGSIEHKDKLEETVVQAQETLVDLLQNTKIAAKNTGDITALKRTQEHFEKKLDLEAVKDNDTIKEKIEASLTRIKRIFAVSD